MLGFISLRKWATAILLAAFLALPASALQYSLTEINYAGDDLIATYALAMNDHNQVVGFLLHAQSESPHVAFAWDPDNGFTVLSPLPGDETHHYIAGGINNAGQIVGCGGVPVLWQSAAMPASTYPELRVSRTISDAGQILCSDYIPDLGYRSYLWKPGQNNPQILAPAQGYDVSDAWGANNLGQVIGYSETSDHPSESLVTLWQPDGTIAIPHNLPPLCRDLKINDLGQIAGNCSRDGIFEDAFFWREDTGTVNIGELFTGLCDSQTYALNNLSQVVGQALHYSQGTAYGFLWQPDRGLMNLNDLLGPSAAGYRITGALDINNNGCILAAAETPDDWPCPVLLTPVPEPAAFALLSLGVLSLRRRKP